MSNQEEILYFTYIYIFAKRITLTVNKSSDSAVSSCLREQLLNKTVGFYNDFHAVLKPLYVADFSDAF